MSSIVLTLMVLTVVAVALAAAVRALLRAWIDHRVNLTLLERTADGEAPGSTAPAPPRQDFAVTGAVLAALGVACMLAGWTLRVGQLAVGAYLGGLICLCLGLLLGLAGGIARAVTAKNRPNR